MGALAQTQIFIPVILFSNKKMVRKGYYGNKDLSLACSLFEGFGLCIRKANFEEFDSKKIFNPVSIVEKWFVSLVPFFKGAFFS